MSTRRLSIFYGNVIMLARKVSILYASETGNAEELAYSLYNTLLSKYPSSNIKISDIQDYDISQLSEESVVVFIISTTGEGDPPSTMKKFWTALLRRSLPPNCLSNVSHAVFGLGDSSYEKFNAAGRRLNKRLEQLGSPELQSIGLGDDQAKFGYLQSWIDWANQLQTKIDPSAGKADQLDVFNSNTQLDSATTDWFLTNGYCVEIANIATEVPGSVSNSIDSQPATVLAPVFSPPIGYKPAKISLNKLNGSNVEIPAPYSLRLTANSLLTRVDWTHEVRHLALSTDLGDSITIDYTAGDVAVVHPLNSPNLVQRAIKVMLARCPELQPIATQNTNVDNHSTDYFLRITNKSDLRRRSRLPTIDCSMSELLSQYLDIAGRPRRSFFSALAYFAENSEEKSKLYEMASPQGTDLYWSYCVQEKRNYVEILEDFPSVRPPLTALLNVISVLQPRSYSIASHSALFPNQVHLCVAVAKSRTKYGRKSVGVCSSYLARLSEGDYVRAWIKQGLFPPVLMPISNLNASNSNLGIETPLILIGPGTGIAPVRAIVQQRVVDLVSHRSLLHHKTQSQEALSEPAKIGHTLVFTGNRRRDADWLYSTEWKEVCSYLNNLILARQAQINVQLPGNSPNPTTNQPIEILMSIWNEVAVSPFAGTNGVNIENKTNTVFESDNLRVISAFSQEGEDGSKIYVTHMIRKFGALVWTALQNGAIVFISGSGNKMPSGVKEALVDVLVTHGEEWIDSKEEAVAFLTQMEREKRIIVDTWS